jgi:hypothetical protein
VVDIPLLGHSEGYPQVVRSPDVGLINRAKIATELNVAGASLIGFPDTYSKPNRTLAEWTAIIDPTQFYREWVADAWGTVSGDWCVHPAGTSASFWTREADGGVAGSVPYFDNSWWRFAANGVSDPTTNATSNALGIIRAYLIYLPFPARLKAIGIRTTTTAASATNVVLGLYRRGANGMPSDRIISSPSTALTTAVSSNTIWTPGSTTYLGRGFLWAAMNLSAATANLVSINASNSFELNQGVNTFNNVANFGISVASPFGELPVTFPANPTAVSAAGNLPRLFFQLSIA